MVSLLQVGQYLGNRRFIKYEIQFRNSFLGVFTNYDRQWNFNQGGPEMMVIATIDHFLVRFQDYTARFFVASFLHRFTSIFIYRYFTGLHRYLYIFRYRVGLNKKT